MPKIVQVFALVLFTTTAVTNCEMSQEEEIIIECNRTLDMIQGQEASFWSYKIEKFFPAAMAVFGWIIPAICCSDLQPEKPGLYTTSGVIGLGICHELKIRADELLKKQNEIKKAIIEKRDKAEAAMKKIYR